MRTAVALLVVIPAVGAGCGGGRSSAPVTPTVVASTSIWADVTAQVACGSPDVTSLVPLGADAHEYEPSVQDADTLRSASLVVANGLGLEEGSSDAIASAERDGATVLVLGPTLDPIETDGASDPHVWMDPDRVAAAVPLIAEQLRDVQGLTGADGRPLDGAGIDACADAYAADLSALGASLDEQFAGLAGPRRKLVTSHESLGYLADRFGFTVVGAIIPSTSSLGESNVRDLQELATTMTEQGVTRIYGEITGSTEVSDALAEQVGAQVQIVELFTESLGGEGSGATTYLDMMRTNGDLIAEQ